MRDEVNVSVPILAANYLLFLSELLGLWMTVKRSFPEIPASLDTAFGYCRSYDISYHVMSSHIVSHIVSHIIPLIVSLLLLDSCFAVVMRINISPIFLLRSQKNWTGVTV